MLDVGCAFRVVIMNEAGLASGLSEVGAVCSHHGLQQTIDSKALTSSSFQSFAQAHMI